MSETVEVSADALAFTDEVLCEQCVCTIYEPSSGKRYRYNRDKNECSECLGAAFDRHVSKIITARSAKPCAMCDARACPNPEHAGYAR